MESVNMNELISKVRGWGSTRGIIGPNGKGTVASQHRKLIQERKEVDDALDCGTDTELALASGYEVVCLILLADLCGLTFEDCLEGAYEKISNRTGKMVGETYVKD